MIDLCKLIFLFGTNEEFRWRNTREFVKERLSILNLSEAELAGGQIRVRKTKYAAIDIDCAQIVRAFRFEQIEVANRAGADDLRDVTRNNLPRLGFAGLIAD